MTHTLLVLAGGKSRRFGRSKQLESVGPNGETLLEYSIFDAVRNGFDRVVVVTSPANQNDLMASLQQLPSAVEVHFVVQQKAVKSRSKPMGTAHALLSAASHLDGAFAVLNADDFYGESAFRNAAAFISCLSDDDPRVGLLVFKLCQTIHNNNPVSRALCVAGQDGQLEMLTELSVTQQDAGHFAGRDAAGMLMQLSGRERISMNFWIMTPAVLGPLAKALQSFLADAGNRGDQEFALPDEIQSLSETGSADVHLIHQDEQTFGLSFPTDKAAVVAHLAQLTQQGDYPAPLWKQCN